MLEAGFWGLFGGSLVLGAALGLWLPIPRRIAALVGLRAGALVSALAFDLTAEAFEDGVAHSPTPSGWREEASRFSSAIR